MTYEQHSAKIETALRAAGFPRGKGLLHRLEAQIIKAGPLMPPTFRLSTDGKDVQIKSYSQSFFCVPLKVYSARQWLKFAFLMDYDTSALEAATEPITAHERMEWS